MHPVAGVPDGAKVVAAKVWVAESETDEPLLDALPSAPVAPVIALPITPAVPSGEHRGGWAKGAKVGFLPGLEPESDE